MGGRYAPDGSLPDVMDYFVNVWVYMHVLLCDCDVRKTGHREPIAMSRAPELHPSVL